MIDMLFIRHVVKPTGSDHTIDLLPKLHQVTTMYFTMLRVKLLNSSFNYQVNHAPFDMFL